MSGIYQHDGDNLMGDSKEVPEPKRMENAAIRHKFTWPSQDGDCLCGWRHPYRDRASGHTVNLAWEQHLAEVKNAGNLAPLKTEPDQPTDDDLTTSPSYQLGRFPSTPTPTETPLMSKVLPIQETVGSHLSNPAGSGMGPEERNSLLAPNPAVDWPEVTLGHGASPNAATPELAPVPAPARDAVEREIAEKWLREHFPRHIITRNDPEIGSLSALLDAEKAKARLEEAERWEHLVGAQHHLEGREDCEPDCMYCARLAELRAAAQGGGK